MRPYNRPANHGERATPATRATVDSILNRLNEESPYASMLHEEIPDWLDIERRPTPPPTPQPVLKPKEKTVIPVTITENPKPRRGKPHPKTDLEEPARAEVAAALKRAGRGPCSVSAELFRHTGMSNWLKTGKGLGPENVAKALEWARNVIALPDEERKPKRRQVISHFANGEAVYAWEDVEEEPAPAFDPEPCTKLETFALVADPAAFVLESWAASKLTYAMETLGLAMPEGYRFRVTVERVAAARP